MTVPVRTPELELVADFPCVTGEGPLWVPERRCLYWVDIPPGHLYRYSPETDRADRVWEAPGPIGGFTVQADGDLLLFMGEGRIMQWNAARCRTVLGVPEQRASRFNDVIAGPDGQVLCGTMSTPEQDAADGYLYLLRPDGHMTSLLGRVGTSNGMGFTPDRKFFFHTDTRTRTVTRYPWSRYYGRFDPTKAEDWYVALNAPDYGRPDGMTVDAQGHLWIAHWDGFGIVHLDARGAVLERLALPVRKVSSVAFGGDDWTDLYVTTAGGDDPGHNGAHAGALYRIRGVARGVPEFRSRILL